MKRISLIVPCLNEEEAIPAFKQEIDRVFKECLEGYAPELIFVDDGSTDRSLEMIKKMAEHSPEVKFISFSRNFGKEAAIYAGRGSGHRGLCRRHGCGPSGSSFPASGYAESH